MPGMLYYDRDGKAVGDPGPGGLMTAGEVAAVFGVGYKTVGRWVAIGKLRCFRTPGGHRRFARVDVDCLLAERTTPKGS